VLLIALARFCPNARQRGPFVPSRDDAVVEVLPLAAGDPDARELRRLERAAQTAPTALDARIALAEKCIELYRRQSDPRYLGRAQAALGELFGSPSPPARVRLLRAILRQSNHDFPGAIADLDVLVRETPDDPEPWLVRAVVLGVLGRYSDAERDCARTRVLAGALPGAACLATPLGMTGRAEEARRALISALGANRRLGVSERAWVLSVLGELERSLGLMAEASWHFEEALRLAPSDPYTLAALADLLLDLGAPERVVELLGRFERIDALLLRLAIAERRLNAPSAEERANELAARFEAARLRGDVTHRREEARYALEVANDPARALELALTNWGVQREAADARVLLAAALAAGRPSAARPVLDFIERAGSKDVTLRALAERAGGAS
jgi:predicted Zn-dependent protease